MSLIVLGDGSFVGRNKGKCAKFDYEKYIPVPPAIKQSDSKGAAATQGNKRRQSVAKSSSTPSTQSAFENASNLLKGIDLATTAKTQKRRLSRKASSQRGSQSARCQSEDTPSPPKPFPYLRKHVPDFVPPKPTVRRYSQAFWEPWPELDSPPKPIQLKADEVFPLKAPEAPQSPSKLKRTLSRTQSLSTRKGVSLSVRSESKLVEELPISEEEEAMVAEIKEKAQTAAQLARTRSNLRFAEAARLAALGAKVTKRFQAQIDIDEGSSDASSDWEDETAELLETYSLVSRATTAPKDTLVGLEGKLGLWDYYNQQPHGGMQFIRPHSARRAFVQSMDDHGRSPLPLLVAPTATGNTLMLTRKGVDDKSATAIAKALKAATKEQQSLMVHLRFDHNRISDQGLAELTAALSHTTFVQTLNVAHNNIGRKSMPALAAVLEDCGSLTSLDLSFNSLSDQGVESLVDGLESNFALKSLSLAHTGFRKLAGNSLGHALLEGGLASRLTHLNLSWNTIRGDLCSLLAQCVSDPSCKLSRLSLSFCALNATAAASNLGQALQMNTSLEFLDLSYNDIDERAALVLSGGLANNSTLMTVVIDGNPIGHAGGCAMLRAIRLPDGSLREISFLHCDLQVFDDTVFDPTDPSGSYFLDLQVPYDRSVVCSLNELSWARQHRATAVRQPNEWRNVKMNNLPFVRPTTTKWEVPFSGIMKFDYVEGIQMPSRAVTAVEYNWLLKQLYATRDGMRKDAIAMIVLFAQSLRYKSRHIMELQHFFDSRSDLVEFLQEVWCKVDDRDNMWTVLKGLYPHELRALETRVTPKYFHFDRRFPTGHYMISLPNRFEYEMARELLMLANQEKADRRAQQCCDVSQHGDGEIWRNVQIDGAPIRLIPGFKLPRKGILEFDYTSTVLPPEHVSPASEKDMEDLMAKLPHVFTRTGWDWWVLGDHYFTCAQIVELANCVAPVGRIAQIQLMHRTVSRVIDLYHWRTAVLEVVFPFPHNDEAARLDGRREEILSTRMQLMSRVGYLTVWNPLTANGCYELDLTVRDMHKVAEGLCRITGVEPGEKWQDERLDDRPFDLPITWVTEAVPKRGVLTMRFNSRRPSYSHRQLELAHTLVSECLYAKAATFENKETPKQSPFKPAE